MNTIKLKRGTPHPNNGKIFWRYDPKTRREDWVTVEEFDIRAARAKVIMKEWLAKNMKRQKENVAGWQTQNKHRLHLGMMYVNARKRARERGLEFDLTKEYIQSLFPADNLCPVFGTEMSWR